MAFFSEDVLRAVRERTDMVVLVGERIALKRAGTNYVGLCPFHAEKTPSFSVNPAKQFFYCFGCQKSGDVFRFLMELDGRGFVEVVEELAHRAGVELPDQEDTAAVRQSQQQQSDRVRLLRVLQWTTAWFEHQLEQSPEALAYLQQRGIEEDTRRRFRLGYAPAGWDGLVQHLSSRKVPTSWIERAGLSLVRARGGSYDRFRNRIVFPLLNSAGEVIAFGGRLLPGSAEPTTEKEGAKYINSPETPLYKKGEHFYGLFHAKEAIRQTRQVVLVEGNMDVLSLHQHGFHQAIAPMGTALTSAQVRLLHRLVGTEGQVVLMLDGDSAGHRATQRDIALFLLDRDKTMEENTLDVRVVVVPHGEDPDTWVQRNPEEVKRQLHSSVPAVDYVLEETIAQLRGAHIAERARVVEKLAPLLSTVRNPTALDLYVDKLSSHLAIPVGSVWKSIRSAQSSYGKREKSSGFRKDPKDGEGLTKPQKKLSIDSLSRQLLAFYAEYPDWLPEAEEKWISMLPDAWVTTLLLQAKQAAVASKGHLDPDFLIAMAPSEAKESVASITFAGIFNNVGRPKHVLGDLYRAIQVKWWHRELNRLKQELVVLSHQGNTISITEQSHQIRDAMETLRGLQKQAGEAEQHWGNEQVNEKERA